MPKHKKNKKRQQKSTIPPPPKSNRPLKRKQWTDEQMEAAIRAVQSSSAVSINRAAKDHNVPVTTLKDRLSGRVIHGTNPLP